MDWQEIIALGVVGISSACLAYHWLRPANRKLAGKNGCSCGSGSALGMGHRGSIVIRGRKDSPVIVHQKFG